MNILQIFAFIFGFGSASVAVGFTDKAPVCALLLIIGGALMFWSLS